MYTNISKNSTFITLLENSHKDEHWKWIVDVLQISGHSSATSPGHIEKGLHYLIGTKTHVILLTTFNDMVEQLCWLEAYSFLDLPNLRSKKSFLVTVNKGPVTCTSGFKSRTAQEKSEAGVNSLSKTIWDVNWLRAILVEQELMTIKPTEYCKIILALCLRVRRLTDFLTLNTMVNNTTLFLMPFSDWKYQ